MAANIWIDSSQVSALAGFLKEVSIQIGTSQHIGPVLQFAHKKLSDEFTTYMTAVAGAAPSRYHHVYEWGQVGDPKGQLWRDDLVGRGSTRIATFTWLASRKTVPVREDFQELGVQQIHIFTWKAPVMEYDTNIRITPKRGTGLSFFTGPTTPPDKYPIGFTRNPITVQYPGGREVKGAFTKAYVDWWAGEGSSTAFDTTVRRLLEVDLAEMPLRSSYMGFKAGTRSRTKSMGFSVVADAAKAEAVGREKARIWLMQRDRNYIGAAEARAAIIEGARYGG